MSDASTAGSLLRFRFSAFTIARRTLTSASLRSSASSAASRGRRDGQARFHELCRGLAPGDDTKGVRCDVERLVLDLDLDHRSGPTRAVDPEIDGGLDPRPVLASLRGVVCEYIPNWVISRACTFL